MEGHGHCSKGYFASAACLGFQDRPGSEQPLPRHGYQEAQGSEAGPAQARCWPGCLTAAPASQPLLGEGEPTSEKANWGQPLARKSPC